MGLYIYIATIQPTVIIYLCPTVEEPGRMEKKSKLETKGKSKKARQRN